MPSPTSVSLRLDAERSHLLESLLAELEPDALHWLAGYVAGLARSATGAAVRHPGAPATSPAATAAVARRATVLYGSQTGNSRRIAERLAEQLNGRGLVADCLSTADMKPRQLAELNLLYLVISTHGEGEPPDDARAFTEFLLGRRAPRLEQLHYGVLALGDSSYPQFCEAGRRLDERLAELGARRLFDRVDADVDFEAPAAEWSQRALAAAQEELGGARLSVVRALHPGHGATPAKPLATRDAPHPLEVLARHPLTDSGALREVLHLELALPQSGFAYVPGDALGIWPENPARTVGRVVETLGAEVDAPVTVGAVTRSVGDWLTHHREITRLTRPFLVEHARRCDDAALRRMLDPQQAAALRDFLHGHQLVDVLTRFPASWDAAGLVATLRPLAPRLYSIASSRAAVGEEVHLAVALLAGNTPGATSHTLATLADDGTLRAFLEPNPRFRLPEDPGADLIMIGAGTGVAPFRGFLQERVETGAGGRHWLVFGGRHLASDFLYQAEWLEALKKGSLQRLDVAFSRDQQEKRYVQHCLLEQARELFAWLEGGAHLYVCGDATSMAPAVEAALLAVIREQGGHDEDVARDYLARLSAQRRYLRDVY